LAKRPEQARLDQLRSNLAQLRRQYTDEHPEVVQLKSEIARAQKAIGDGSAEVPSGGELSPSRLRYLQLTADKQALRGRVQRLRLALMGLLAGLGCGIALAFLAQQADTSYRSMEDFALPSGPPVLAEIPTIAWRSERSLLPASTGNGQLVADKPVGAAAEQFRI